MNAGLVIRPMLPEDLPFAHQLSRSTGWNQTAADWARFLSMEPEGCFVAEWDGTLAGTVTTTAYESSVGWIGMLLVVPVFQGQGIGKALLQTAMDSLHQRGVACIKLDATPAGRPLYERIGFKAEWPFQRWQAEGFSQRPSTHPGMRALQQHDLHRLQELDLQAFGVPRLKLLEALLAHGARGVCHADGSGVIDGFGFIRPGERAHYLGPVVANDASMASSIVQALLASAQQGRLFWDIPDHQFQSLALAESLGFAPQRPLTRMFLGGRNVPGNPALVHALSAPETG